MKPNVLLIVLDTVRADALEPYGAAPGASPAIAQLAAQGEAAPAAHATACWTVPSHASMFTGLLPRAAGLVRAPGGMPHGCRPVLESQKERLLASVLGAAGYSTRGVSTNLWLTPASGFATGFDEFRMVDTDRQGSLSGGSRRERLRWAWEAALARADDGARAAGEILGEWISAPQRAPAFWFANLIEAHSPYMPPRPWNDLGLRDRVRAAAEARAHLTLGEIWRACAGGFDVPDEAIERMRRLYAAAVRRLDDWIAEVLERLDSAGMLEDTLVIVASDHGENLGEQGLMGHAFSLDQRLIHVPLVWSGPGADPLERPLSLAELPRLIAGVADLADHPWREELPPLPVAQFEPPAAPGEPGVDVALEAWGLGEEAEERITNPLLAACDGRWKLLLRGDRELVFDLDADPLEDAPLAEAPPEPAIEELRAAVSHSHARAEPGPEPEPEEVAAGAEAEDLEALEERMKLLGYM